MINSNSGKHARKVTLDAAVSNAIAKAVDARKVAAFTVGAAGVLAGAAFAFGATPAMAAENGVTPDTKLAPVTAGENPGVDAGNAAGVKDDAKPEDNKAEKNNQADGKAQPEVNKEAEEQAENPATTNDTNDKSTVAKKRIKSAVKENPQTDAATSENQDRASNGDIKEVAFSSQTGEMPNVYGFGTVDNQYDEQLANNPITFKLPKQKDDNGADKAVTRVTVFPSPSNHINTPRTSGSIDFDSDNNGHQPYSGEYVFNKNNDGSATLTMNRIFRKDERGDSKGIKNAQGYSATRSIQINPIPVQGSAKEDAVSDQFRAALLVPPQSAGTIVKKVSDADITDTDVNNAMDDAKKNGKTTHVGKSGIDGLSLEAQIQALSKVGKRKLDTIDKKIPTGSNEYDKNALTKANSKVGVSIVNTHFVTDLGFKSQDIPLTIVRYNDVIDKPIVEDPTNISEDVKEEIKTKLAKINGITADKISFDGDNAVIHFDGVDEKDAPKIALRDLVLKKFTEDQIKVPAESTATVIYNPLAYSDAEIRSIKKAIYEANKDKTELGLSATDYENQISLSYLTGNLTKTGHANQGISNGQAENTITVKIKTDKAVAEFTSDVKAHKLTRLADIRKDYNVSWKNNKIAGRDTDEGLSWSEDGKTIIYRYDPTAAKEFDTNKILNLLKATPKDPNSGLRDLTGNEKLDHEGVDGKAKKSHVGYVIDKNGQPTTELSLGNMSGANWQYSQKVDNSGVDLGDNLSEAGSYSWDNDAKPVFVAAKKGKVYKARLFVLPYGLTMYRNVYMENGNQPWNTPKAINVIFVPQTNHKTSDLKKSVDDHKTENVDGKDVPTQSAYYNASDKVKEAYDKALQTAKDLYESVKDTEESKLTEQQKAQIDNATINLNKAREALDGAKTNKDGLDKSITEDGAPAQGQNPASGTQATDRYKNVTEPDFKTPDGKADEARNNAAKEAKKAYDEALQAAKDAKANDNATQKDVDAAKAKLDAARAKLNDFTTSKDKLNAAIAEHGQVNTGDTKKTDPAEKLKTADPTYQNSTPEQRDAYDKAVAEAQKVVADPNASQKEVNKAIDDLKKAKAALDANATNKAPLDAAVQKTLDNDSNKHSVFYTNAAAKKDTDAAAKKAVEDYDKALAEAKRVLGDKNATKADVDKAKKDLEDAEKVLYAETYQTKTTDLAEAIADNFSGYLMPAYFNAFDKAQAEGKDSQAAKDFKAYNDAYHAAKDLMEQLKKLGNTIKQTEVDAVKNQLIEARKIIDAYATDTSRLSAAALNDLAIQKSPAYKNVSADDASKEAKEAKKKYDAAVEKLKKALTNKLDKDPDAQDTKIPDAKGDPTSKNYLDGIQKHANGEPLDRDVDAILKEMNAAAAELNKFATKTDKLLESINKDTDTQHDPAYKNTKDPAYKKVNEPTVDDTKKNGEATAAKKAYDEALKAAKELMVKPDATQKDVNDALKKLDDARTALDVYKTDVSKLQESANKHGKEKQGEAAATEGTVTSDAYRNASDPHFLKLDNGKLVPDTDKNNKAAEAKKAYDKALAEAQDLLKKADTKSNTPLDAQPTQKEIDAALKALDDARTEIEKYKTVTTDLEKEINKSTAEHAPAVTENDFENTPEFKNANDKNDNEDVKAYNEALKKARDLVKAANPTDPAAVNSSHPTQQQINDALDALTAAKKQITDNYKTNLEPLTSAKDFAGGDFKNTPEYQNAVAKKTAGDQGAKKDLGEAGQDKGFDNVLAKVVAKLQDNAWKQKATQKDVNALLKQLQDAQDKIAKDYKTDALKLEREVGDKDQDGRPVTPPFEASVPYKNALEKAKTEDPATTDANSATKKLKEYTDKLAEAQKLIDKVNNPDPNAKPEDRPTQDDVDKALAALKQAKKDIDDNFKTKVDKLQNEVEDKNEDGTARTSKFEESTEYKNLKGKTKDSKKPDDLVAYEQALAKAKELIDKNDGKMTDPNDSSKQIDVPKDQLPTQQEVDEAKKALKEIKDKILANYKTNSTELQMEVDKSKDGEDDQRDTTFENTPEFKNATDKGDEAAKNALDDYNKKLQAAKALLDKFDRTTGKPKQGETAPTQKELDDALDALKAAKKKITDGYKTNKSDLNTEAGKDSDFTKTPEYVNAQAKGDDASKQALDEYKKALEDANKVLGDKNATQAQVDEALKKLQDAKKKLTDSNKTDKSKLQTEADADAKFRKSVYFIIGNKDDIEAYKKALAEADSVLNDPNATQAQVDEALRKLQAAKYKINHPFGVGSGVGSGSGYDTDADAGDGFDTSDSQSASVDKSALQVEVNNSEADSSAASKANTDAARAYVSALAEAKRVLADKNATQAQVDEALRKLQAAKAAWRNASGASGNASGLAKTGAATGLFASLAAVFSGLGVAGVASRRRKHSNE